MQELAYGGCAGAIHGQQARRERVKRLHVWFCASHSVQICITYASVCLSPHAAVYFVETSVHLCAVPSLYQTLHLWMKDGHWGRMREKEEKESFSPVSLQPSTTDNYTSANTHKCAFSRPTGARVPFFVFSLLNLWTNYWHCWLQKRLLVYVGVFLFSHWALACPHAPPQCRRKWKPEMLLMCLPAKHGVSRLWCQPGGGEDINA